MESGSLGEKVSAEPSSRKRMKYDDLVEHVGEFGPYQRRIYFLACLPAITASIHAWSPVFILSVPEFRCAIPGLANDTYESQGEWHQKLINYTLPWTDAGNDDATWGAASCSVYKNRNALNYGDSFDAENDEKTSCHRWVYDKSVFESSFVTQIDMVCDNKVLRSHANMIFMCGYLTGSFVFGVISDRLGRRSATLIALALHLVTSIAITFSTNFAVFAVLRFLVGLSSIPLFMCCFVMAIEIVGKRWRAQAGTCFSFYWCMGMFVLNAVAYFVRNWQHLQLILSCYIVLYLVVYWFLPESPRWQISQGQVDKAHATLEKMARANGKELPAIDLGKDEKEAKGRILDIFASPALTFRLIVVFFNWLVVTLVYYGLTLNVGSLDGSVYVNFALSAIVETLGNVSCLWGLPVVGRKRFHCFAMILGGLACLASIFPAIIGTSSPSWVILMLSNIGKFGSTIGFKAMYIVTAELFPTPLRNSVVGTSSTVARLGGIAAPYVADLGVLVHGVFGAALPYVVFGTSSLVVGLLALTLPETLNQPIPETMEDAINLGKTKPTQTETSDKILQEKF